MSTAQHLPMGKFSFSTMACVVVVFCAATAIASSAQAFTSLVSFNITNGAYPNWQQTGDGTPGGALIQHPNGNFYGTTGSGGNAAPICTSESGEYGCGTVFSITPDGTLNTIYSFCSLPNCADGFFPIFMMLASDGNFYGFTAGSGNGYGPPLFFQLTPGGVLTVLNGVSPAQCNQFIQASDGNFYGYGAGTHGYGSVCKLAPGGWVETDLYDFTGGTDGAGPSGELVQAADGNFYGVTNRGGDLY